MIIKDSAKKYFESNFDNYINGIIININKSCCVIGEDIRIAFIHIDNDYELINGIKVRYDKLDNELLKDLVIDYKNNMIVYGD